MHTSTTGVSVDTSKMQISTIIKEPQPAMGADTIEGDELLTATAICLNDLLLLVNKGSGGMPSSMTLLTFIFRIRKFGKCSDACFLVALIYLDRIVNTSGFVLTPHNVHRIMLTAVMVAAKFHEDHFYNNAFFAKLGDVAIEEMNSSEIELLQQLRFSLVVTGDLYNKYHLQLCCYRERACALAKCRSIPVSVQATPPGALIAQPVLVALPLSPGGSVLATSGVGAYNYRHSPPDLAVHYPMAAAVVPVPVGGGGDLYSMAPPPGLTRATTGMPIPVPVVPLQQQQQQQQQQQHVYQVVPMPHGMPVALPATPEFCNYYHTPPFMAKQQQLSFPHNQCSNQQNQLPLQQIMVGQYQYPPSI